VQNNYMSDTARYIGLGVEQPALHIGNGGDGHDTGVVENATMSQNTVNASLYNAVGFSRSAQDRSHS
jgi:hypothetical protein